MQGLQIQYHNSQIFLLTRLQLLKFCMICKNLHSLQNELSFQTAETSSLVVKKLNHKANFNFCILTLLILLHLPAPTKSSLCTNGQNNCLTCLSSSQCLYCSPFYRLTSSHTCQKCWYNGCSICHYNTKQCLQWMVGFQYIGGMIQPCAITGCGWCGGNLNNCFGCVEGFLFISSTFCHACPLNCKKCTVEACLQCFPGFYLVESNCVSCGIANCSSCYDNFLEIICDTCISHYRVNSLGECQKCSDIACQVCTNKVDVCEQCERRFGPDSKGKCVICTSLKCVQCSHNSSICQKCQYQNNLTLINGSCASCSNPYCSECHQNDYCTVCSVPFVLDHGDCICPDPLCLNCTSVGVCESCRDGYGIDLNNSCSLCVNSPSQCLTCNQTNWNQCLTCPYGKGIFIQSCITCPENCSSCEQNSTLALFECTSCISSRYQILNLNSSMPRWCYDLCGNLHKQGIQQCDNQLGRINDGCDDNCHIQQNFTCFYMNRSRCSFNYSLDIKFLTFDKTPGSNSFNLKVAVQPLLYILSTISEDDLKILFNINSSKIAVNRVKYDSVSGIIQFSGFLTDSLIIEETLEVRARPSLLDLIEFNLTLESATVFILGNSYFFISQEDIILEKIVQYWCFFILALSWVGWIIGILVRKLPGLESIFVVQLAYLTFVCSNFQIISLFYRTYPLKYASGYNQILEEEDLSLSKRSTQIWPHLSEFQLGQIYLSNNFNLSMILMLIAVIIWAVSIIRLKYYKAKWNFPLIKYQQQNERKQKYAILQKLTKQSRIGYEIALNTVLLCFTYFFGISSFFFKQGSLTHSPSLAVFIIQALITILTFIKFYYDPSLFGCFRESFRIYSLALNHYFFLIITIALIVLLLVFTESSWSPIIPAAVMLIFTILYRPYKYTSENIRSAMNFLVIVSCLLFRVYIEFICNCTSEKQAGKLNENPTRIFFIVNLGLLFIVVILGIIASLRMFHYEEYVVPRQQKKLIKQKKEKRRDLLAELDKIDPTLNMSDIELETKFKQFFDPSKNLLKLTNQLYKPTEQNLSIENNLAFKKDMEELTKKQGRDIRRIWYENNLFQTEEEVGKNKKQQNRQLPKDENEEKQEVIQVVRDQNRYINLKSAINVTKKLMEAEVDMGAIQEYDNIDANYSIPFKQMKKQTEDKMGRHSTFNEG